ncbi:hypothetical protein AB0G32_13510 [Streptomyces sp. NPDC023723]|uniref:hypothetical protein n=1 Tax=Streptomyces sp. NPDC023723 TaxID=3154323 RepID=UPI003406FAEF
MLIHPGATRTSLSGRYDEPTLRCIEEQQRTAKPISEVLGPIDAAVDDPPKQALSAFVEGREPDVRTPGFDGSAARRLDRLTEEFLAGR